MNRHKLTIALICTLLVGLAVALGLGYIAPRAHATVKPNEITTTWTSPDHKQGGSTVTFDDGTIKSSEWKATP